MPDFNFDNTVRGVQYEGGDNGVGTRLCYAEEALTVGAPVKVFPTQDNGWSAELINSEATQGGYLGCVLEAAATGAYTRIQTEGLCTLTSLISDATWSAGYGAELDGGEVADVGAAFSGPATGIGCYGVLVAKATSASTGQVFLTGLWGESTT